MCREGCKVKEKATAEFQNMGLQFVEKPGCGVADGHKNGCGAAASLKALALLKIMSGLEQKALMTEQQNATATTPEQQPVQQVAVPA